MPEKNADGATPQPRLVWLALFQLLIISLVVLMAQEARQVLEPALLEDQLSTLSDASPRAMARRAGRDGRRAPAHAAGRLGICRDPPAPHLDPSVVTTIMLLPIAVAAILVIVQDSLAVAFSLAGIAGLVRFRNALDDTRDAMYVVIAIAVGLGAGVGTLEAAAALSGLYNLAVVALWKWNTSQPVIADIALGEQSVPKGQTVLQALLPDKDGERHPKPVAEWFEPGEKMPLAPGAAAAAPPPVKREGILRVHAADDIPDPTRHRGRARQPHQALDPRVRRSRARTAPPTLTYRIRLKKRTASEALLEALRGRLGPRLAEYTPSDPPTRRRVGAHGVRVPAISVGSCCWRPALRGPGRARRGQAPPHYDLAGAPAWRAELPRATCPRSPASPSPPTGGLLAHGDEQAAVWRFDLASAPVRWTGSGSSACGGMSAGRLRGHRSGRRAALPGDQRRRDLRGHDRPPRTGHTGPPPYARASAGGCEVGGADLGRRRPGRSCCSARPTRSKQWKDQVVILAVSTETWRFEPRAPAADSRIRDWNR